MARPYDDGRSPTRIASTDGRLPDKGRRRGGNSIVTLPPERLYERRPDYVDDTGDEQADDREWPSQTEDDEAILALARQRFQTSVSAEATLRQEMVSDQRFYGGHQWPDQIKADRTNDKRPIITINRLPAFVKQITNPQRQSRPSIQVNPVGDGADPDTAEVIQGLIRHIEHTSHAEVAYDEAYEDAVVIGRGWFRILTEYIDDGTFDQEIVVKRIPNALSVYPDPAATELDYSDARYIFIVDDIPKDEYRELYGDASTASLEMFIGAGNNRTQDWFPEGRVRIAEYFYVTHEMREMCLIRMAPVAPPTPPGPPISTDGMPPGGPAGLPPGLATGGMPPGPPGAPPAGPMMGAPGMPPPEMMGGPPKPPEPLPVPEEMVVPKEYVPEGATILRTRKVKQRVVNWIKMNAAEILERRTWQGRWIPIIPILGDEIMVDGQRTLVGIVRFARDPQRMYNYWVTHLTEMIALAPRVPFIGAEGQFKGHEAEWKQANIKNFPFLEYVPVSLDGKPVPAPQRQQFEPPIQAATLATRQADNDLKAVIGLYDASLGEKGPDESGKAILARQKQGELTNVNFIDNFGRALWHAARVYLDLIPKVFDTERVIHIMGADDQRKQVIINTEFIQRGAPRIFDVRLGRYSITMALGPSYQNRRQEAVASMLQLVKGAPQLIPIIGDLMVGEMDWPVSRQIAERLKKMLPPQLQDHAEDGEDIPPQAQAKIAQMQAELEALKQVAQSMGKVIETKQIEIAGKKDVTQMTLAAQAEEGAKDREVKLAVAELGAKIDRMALFFEERARLGAQEHDTAVRGADARHEQELADTTHRQTMEQQQSKAQVSTDGKLAEGEQKHGHALVQGEQGHRQTLEQQQQGTAGKIVEGQHGHAQKLEQQQATTLGELHKGAQGHKAKLAEGAQGHRQKLVQGAQGHQQKLAEGEQTHRQTLVQGERSHKQTLEQGDRTHQHTLEQGKQAAKLAPKPAAKKKPTA